MKIVKEFVDEDFLKRSAPDSVWSWGLGDDGWVYCKCSVYEDPNKWSLYGYALSLKTMCKIVKEFGHLLVWM
jgi:hypothetical protein